MINRYLRERGDANIKTNADLIAKARFYRTRTSRIASRRASRPSARRRWIRPRGCRARFALQTMLLQCMQEQRLDALVSPMSTVPPRKLTSPREPAATAARRSDGRMIGQQGFPGHHRAGRLHDERVGSCSRRATSTRLVGPVAAALPVGVDFIARPFDEPLLFRIASAYEAATKHRRPPADFGPLPAQR